jgi:glycosyltransferase involved in cell wall biosynthesis
MVQVHQFHPSVAYGDAIGNTIQELKIILTELGYKSEIFAQYIHPRVLNVKNYSEYSKYSSPDNIIILHYSIGYDPEILNYFKSLPDKKILIYHNITPSGFFKGVNDIYEHSTRRGRDELSEFKKIITIALGVSQFNVDELRCAGFKNTDVLPIPVNFKRFEIAGNSDIIKKYSDNSVNILTVARISPNKKIEDVIKTFYFYKKAINPNSRLFLVGSSEGMETYYSQLIALIKRLQLEDVYFSGFVSDADLNAYYRISDVFITMSEHEGFCVPLLESMYFDLPVIANNSSAIPHTMGNAGILVNEKNPIYIAEIINLLIIDHDFGEKIVQQQRQRLKDFDRDKIKEKLSSIIASLIQTRSHGDIIYRIEGPFDSSYSLALVNREMAIALNQLYPGKVALYSTEGPGNFEPDQAFLSKHPDIEELWNKSKLNVQPEVVGRNLYPPRVSGMQGKINILTDYGWEESGFPQKYVDDFNRELDGIAVTSTYVKKVLIDNGVRVPISAVGDGVDHIHRTQSKRLSKNLGTKFKFLHVSSGFPRKGIDVLLSAYVRAFSKNDNVSLIIKTFPNIHNNVEDQIEKIRLCNPDCGEILSINQDLDHEYLIDLYNQCDVLVAPSRGEGFGLPIAEAMLCGLPVITTGYGGQTDFCTNENAWLIDYTFKKAETHMELEDSVWAEPDTRHLAELMRKVHVLSPAEKAKKTIKAQENIQNNYSWAMCASRLDKFITSTDFTREPGNRKILLGWVTSWNTKCGVASYSKYLLNNLDAKLFDLSIFASTKDIPLCPDEKFVYRTWENAIQPDLSVLTSQILARKLDIIIFQFNFGFFNLEAFESMIATLLNNKIKIIIFFHSTADVVMPNWMKSLQSISKTLKKVDRLFVHSVDDLNRMKDFGLVENVTLFPQGVFQYDFEDSVFIKSQFNLLDKKIIASYGFLLPHKGIKELILAFYQLSETNPQLHLLLVNAIHPSNESAELKSDCITLIKKLNLSGKVTLLTEYLTDEESLLLLKCADLIVFPYQNTQESSSAAVRHGIASLKPVACTPLPIFNDVSAVVHILPGISPELIAKGILQLLENPTVPCCKDQSQKKWVEVHSWNRLMKRLENIIWAITRSNNE